MSIWLHRISHHAEVAYPLLDQGYLTIGYSDFSEAEFVAEVCSENGRATFEKYFDDNWGCRPKTRNNLWRFIAEMGETDLVIVPGWGTFSVYELTEDMAKPVSEINITEVKDWHGNLIVTKEDGLLYRKDPEETRVDIGFVRKVKLLQKDIPRYDYADSALNSRMKIRSANADISDLRSSLEKALVSFEKGLPLNVYAQILAKTHQQILDTIREELTDTKFELMVKWYFQRIGATEVYIPAKNEHDKEGDADVVAVFEPIRTIIYAQVKFHKGETNTWAVEQILSYKDHKEIMDDGYSKICWVISTADTFSSESYDLAKEEKVQLVDGRQFTKLLIEAGLINLDKAI